VGAAARFFVCALAATEQKRRMAAAKIWGTLFFINLLGLKKRR
jgi:hypothetical protein